MKLSFSVFIFFILISCGDDPKPLNPIDFNDPETPVGSGNNDVLVWFEEFDYNGAPCSTAIPSK